VPARHLLTSWRLDDFQHQGSERIAADLESVGIRAEPPLSQVDRETRVRLALLPEDPVPPWGLTEPPHPSEDPVSGPATEVSSAPTQATKAQAPTPAPARPRQDAASTPARRQPSRRLVRAGFVLAGLSLVLGVITAIPALIIGIVVSSRGRKRTGGAIIALAVMLPVLAAVLLFAVLGIGFYRTPSQSMEPTLNLGDRVFTAKVSDPQPGDIAVFHPPRGADQNGCGVRYSPRSACPRPTADRSATKLIKRVVAAGGDRVRITGGHALVNGVPEDDFNIRPDDRCGVCNLPQEITVPKGYYFMMGDNRGKSADSREWGPVPKDAILGTVRLRYWPLADFGTP
jgi:signal peptidase I